jgi:hypothetical protein
MHLIDCSDTQVYHDTLGSALAEIESYAQKRNLSLIDADGLPLEHVTCEHVAYGTTARVNVQTTKPATNKLGYKAGWIHASIYRLDSGRYELTVYHS